MGTRAFAQSIQPILLKDLIRLVGLEKTLKFQQIKRKLGITLDAGSYMPDGEWIPNWKIDVAFYILKELGPLY